MAKEGNTVLERFFQLKQNNTTVRTEILAGLTTFFTIAYVIVVNPSILSLGDERIYNGVLFATCISAFIGTMLMALLARMPLAQAPGMGLNAFFAYTVMPAMLKVTGVDLSVLQQYHAALAMVLLSGVLFIIITVVGAREAIVRAIPHNMKLAISGGIGLFLAYLGLQSAGIVVPNAATQVALVDLAQLGSADPAQRNAAMGAVLALAGLIIITALHKLRVKGAILIGILATGVLAYFPLGVAQIPQNFNINLGAQARDFVEYSLFQVDFSVLSQGGSIVSTLFTCFVLVLSFSMVDMFDTIGMLLGTASKAGLINEKGEMVRMNEALLCDAVATTAGALLGTSTVTTYVESNAGIAEGGRTGLTALTTALCFIPALLAAPFVALIPGVATAPALIFVGALMLGGIKEMDFDDISESVPGFLTIAMMPLTYSIANGIGFGIISHCLIKLLCGRVRETHWITWLLAVLFLLKFVLAV